MLLELLSGNISQEEYLVNNDIKLLYKKLPQKVYGCVFNYKNYNYIIINTSLSDRKAKHTILHEFAHIELNHLSRKKSLLEFKIEGLEDEADEYIRKIMEEINYAI